MTDVVDPPIPPQPLVYSYNYVEITAGGKTINCNQKVLNGVVVGYVDAQGQTVAVPKVREEQVLDSELTEPR